MPTTTGTVLVEAKSWKDSRTIWLSILSVVTPLLLYIVDNALALDIPEQAIPWIALVIFALGTIRQRLDTTQPVGHPGELVPVDGAVVDAAEIPELTNAQLLQLAHYLRELVERERVAGGS